MWGVMRKRHSFASLTPPEPGGATEHCSLRESTSETSCGIDFDAFVISGFIFLRQDISAVEAAQNARPAPGHRSLALPLRNR
jgi:hypothetical protein